MDSEVVVEQLGLLGVGIFARVLVWRPFRTLERKGGLGMVTGGNM